MPMPTEAPVVRARAPPPPVPVSQPALEKEPVAPLHAAAPDPPSKQKPRGLMRAIGVLFKRKNIDSDDPMAASDSEASQRRTSRWSRWSNRQSLPEAPMEVVVASAPTSAPIQECDSVASSPHMVEPPAKKAKKMETPVKEKKTKLPSQKGKQSPTDPSDLLLDESSDESGAEPKRLSFLFYGGSDVDSTFTPHLRPSELDDLHENEIRPSLQAKMPLFLSPPWVEKTMRRSSILPDPKEYEF